MMPLRVAAAVIRPGAFTLAKASRRAPLDASTGAGAPGRPRSGCGVRLGPRSEAAREFVQGVPSVPGGPDAAWASLGHAPFEAGYAAPTSARAILLTRRKPGKRHAGQWELPGGKLEPGEDGPQCLVRELAEELGVIVTIGAFVMEHVHDYGSDPRQGRQIALAAWEATLNGGHWVLADHDRLAWVEPADLAAFDLAAADIPIARRLAGDAP